MKTMRITTILAVILLLGAMPAITAPNEQDTLRSGTNPLQAAYVARGFGMFLHFNMGTFTQDEWCGHNLPNFKTLFNPTALDTDQWTTAARSAGMKYAVLTVKHHDGFSLYDSPRSQYDVANTDWYARQKPDDGDIVKRFVESCRKNGLAVGFYFSVWDKTAGIKRKGGIKSEEATLYIKNELSHLLTRYGTIDILWTDGWGWVGHEETGYGYVRFQDVYDHIRKISPRTLLVENNHEGNLTHSDIIEAEAPYEGGIAQDNKLPAETCDTLRSDGSWFYHSSRDPNAIKPVGEVVKNLQVNRAHHAAYLLNVTPDTSGRIPGNQMNRLKEIGQALSGRTSTLNPIPSK